MGEIMKKFTYMYKCDKLIMEMTRDLFTKYKSKS